MRGTHAYATGLRARATFNPALLREECQVLTDIADDGAVAEQGVQGLDSRCTHHGDQLLATGIMATVRGRILQQRGLPRMHWRGDSGGPGL